MNYIKKSVSQKIFDQLNKEGYFFEKDNIKDEIIRPESPFKRDSSVISAGEEIQRSESPFKKIRQIRKYSTIFFFN